MTRTAMHTPPTPATPPATHARSGITTVAMLGVIAAGSVAIGSLYLSLSTMWAGADAAEAEAKAEKKLEATSAHQALVMAGLTPATLAAVGLDGPEVTSLLGAAEAYLVAAGVPMALAIDNQASAASEVATLEDKVVSGRATEQQKQDLASARTELAAAQAARQGAVDAFVESVTIGWTQDQRDALASIRSQAGTTVSPEYLVVPRSEPDLVELRNAIAARRIAERNGTDVPGQAAGVLANAESDTAVGNARDNTEANLAAIRAVWDQAFGRR